MRITSGASRYWSRQGARQPRGGQRRCQRDLHFPCRCVYCGVGRFTQGGKTETAASACEGNACTQAVSWDLYTSIHRALVRHRRREALTRPRYRQRQCRPQTPTWTTSWPSSRPLDDAAVEGVIGCACGLSCKNLQGSVVTSTHTRVQHNASTRPRSCSTKSPTATRLQTHPGALARHGPLLALACPCSDAPPCPPPLCQTRAPVPPPPRAAAGSRPPWCPPWCESVSSSSIGCHTGGAPLAAAPVRRDSTCAPWTRAGQTRRKIASGVPGAAPPLGAC